MSAAARLRAGGSLLLQTDAASYVVQAAVHVSAASIAFMAREARGLVCLALPAARCRRLGLEPMAPRGAGTEPMTVTIEAREGVSTGISAADRARTIGVAMDPAADADSLVRPGHVVPLRAHDEGVARVVRAPEAAVDLTRLAGLPPGAVLCAVLDAGGALARGAALTGFARANGLPAVALADVVAWRARQPRGVIR